MSGQLENMTALNSHKCKEIAILLHISDKIFNFVNWWLCYRIIKLARFKTERAGSQGYNQIKITTKLITNSSNNIETYLHDIQKVFVSYYKYSFPWSKLHEALSFVSSIDKFFLMLGIIS